MFRTALLLVGLLQPLISIASARTVPAKFERAILLEIVLGPDTFAYVRFQPPRPGQTTVGARVTQLDWNSDVASVTSTYLDFFNTNGQNDPLWRSFDIPSLQYAGLFTVSCVRGMLPQIGLDRDNVTVSVILPSGVAKLQTMGGDTSGFSDPDREAVTGIFGISGTLDPTDFAYTTVANIRAGLDTWAAIREPENVDGFLRLALINGNGDTVPISVPLVR